MSRRCLPHLEELIALAVAERVLQLVRPGISLANATRAVLTALNARKLDVEVASDDSRC